MDDEIGSTLSRDGTFSQRTEAVLRERILDGSIAPGERVNEVALAGALGISRGPLREAIQHLAGEGLLTIISHRGAFVRTFEPREIHELYDLRTAYEMHAARLACVRASEEQLADFVDFVAATGDIMSAEGDGRYPVERDFHSQLIALADNVALARAAAETQAQISLARSMSAKVAVRAKAALDEHADIADALAQRSADDAARCVQIHLDEARTSAMAALGFDDNPRKTE
ncbi:GntR family transcriptional regulator [Aeromicrobium sp. CF3.5]|uniref:GntR family transcriptional regulator n=1 Tax=Aeromicrobium sp. CF3.5 TaxID=3373078 RepID=UPI003EE5BEBB